jgi:hypothetical protein
MRRILTVALLVLVILAVLAPLALAHEAGPCNDSGEPGNSDFAKHHIVPFAQEGDLGATDHDGDGTQHVPGSHKGYSACV